MLRRLLTLYLPLTFGEKRTLLRLIKEKSHAHGALKQLQAIFAEWEAEEDLARLRANLGLDSNKRRRKGLTVKKELKICKDMFWAAAGGADLHTFGLAADAIDAEPKNVERAWKAWAWTEITFQYRDMRIWQWWSAALDRHPTRKTFRFRNDGREYSREEMEDGVATYKAICSRLPPFDIK